MNLNILYIYSLAIQVSIYVISLYVVFVHFPVSFPDFLLLICRSFLIYSKYYYIGFNLAMVVLIEQF